MPSKPKKPLSEQFANLLAEQPTTVAREDIATRPRHGIMQALGARLATSRRFVGLSLLLQQQSRAFL